jgi:hypothetical protein
VVLEQASADGAVFMGLYDEDGTTLLDQGLDDGNRLLIESAIMDQDKTLLLEVAGEAVETERLYSLVLQIQSGSECQADDFEQNDGPLQAGSISVGEYPGLTCCADPDWYRLDLNQGQNVRVSIMFAHQEGDLDLWVFDRETVEGGDVFSCENSLGCSTSETDDEMVQMNDLPVTDYYFIAVYPYQGAENSYTLAIDVMP